MPPPPTNDGNQNIYGCMVDVSKLTPAQQEQHDVILLEHYHKLCNTNNLSSTFIYPPPIPNIESFSQSTISSLDSGAFDRKQTLMKGHLCYTTRDNAQVTLQHVVLVVPVSTYI